MKLSFRLILIVFFGLFLSSCAAQTTAPMPVYKDKEVSLWKSCTIKDAESLGASAKDADLLESISCYASLFESGTVDKTKYAEAGQKVAKAYLTKNPKSGVGHYLYAYLVGKHAELSPLSGLDLVPVLEQEALLAVKLSPEVDFAGPDRMLGELYLDAPGAPLSVGSLSKSLKHFEAAVKVAPDFYLNHLGYGAALLEDDDKKNACIQFSTALKSKSFNNKSLENDTYKKLIGACQKAPAPKK
ncbi:hypothetical protein [Maridesulfovibrio frigidus]|uniref:hypothetical protein n=1 Tax=Maridesulfovibrio frigidus TaxID=340956 RepID=UPI0004E109E6|nr:hypothetical protein [Maridesulfovibrio frigidus]